jgi:subtilisin family serine protease
MARKRRSSETETATEGVPLAIAESVENLLVTNALADDRSRQLFLLLGALTRPALLALWKALRRGAEHQEPGELVRALAGVERPLRTAALARAAALAAPDPFEARVAIEAPGIVEAPAGLTMPVTLEVAPPFPSSDLLVTRLTAIDRQPQYEVKKMDSLVETAMDPRLQLAITNHRSGKRGLAFASTTGQELPVVARVKSVEEWEALPDVFPAARMGKVGKDWIVTGRVPIDRIEEVRAAPTVVSLKGSQPIHPALDATLPAMSVVPALLPAGTAADGGKGVVVGVIDFGCDFAHRNFRRKDGSTRLLALWDQAGVAMPGSPHGYGRVYTQVEINAALKSANPYAALGYGPPVDPQGTHGTHVLDIAAGNGLGSTQSGVAPEADLVFVELAVRDIAFQGPEATRQVFGDSVQFIEAVGFVFETADDRPCVCNLSLGTNGGPHDGTTLAELALDGVVNEKPNRAVVVAAGNSQLHGIHASGTVPGTGTHDIEWKQLADGGGEIDLWYPGASRLEVTLIAPDGSSMGPVAPGTNSPFQVSGNVAVFVSNRIGDPNNGDNVMAIWVAEGLWPGTWRVRLRSTDGKAVDYHAWIERNDFKQASFMTPVNSHSLGSISTGADSIVVGSYNAHSPKLPISNFSSAGPTRDGRNKPEVSAPGQNVMAARSRTPAGVIRKSGTSMAAPAVAGLVALIFAEARRKKKDLSIADLRKKLLDRALINPPAIAANGWDGQFGHGRADGAAIKV